MEYLNPPFTGIRSTLLFSSLLFSSLLFSSLLFSSSVTEVTECCERLSAILHGLEPCRNYLGPVSKYV